MVHKSAINVIVVGRGSLMLVTTADPSRPLTVRAERPVVGLGRALGAVLVLTAFFALTIPRGVAQTLPERYAGVWVQGECSDAERVRLVNSLAVIDVLQRDGEPHLQILAINAARPGDQGVDLELAMADGETFDSHFSMEGDRLNDYFARCDTPPPAVAWTLGEVVTLFDAAGRIHSRCRDDAGAGCVIEIFRAIDVSDDGVLREAEIARVLRAVGFVVGYATNERVLVPVRDLLMPSAIGSMVAPTIASGMVANYDYDGDGGLSLDELLQDRGDRAGLVAALGSAEVLAADISMDAAIGFIKTMAGPLLGSLPTP